MPHPQNLLDNKGERESPKCHSYQFRAYVLHSGICVLVSTPSTTIMKFTVVLVFLLSNSIALDCTMKLWISETPCVSTSNSIAVENGTGSDEAAIPFSPSP